MKNISLLLVSLFGFTTLFSQKTIVVQARHSKKLIHTMKNGEFFATGESKISIKQNGLDYEFLTQTDNYTFNLYKNGKFLGNYAQNTFSDDDFKLTKSKNLEETAYYAELKNGRKYGPYKYISPIYKNEKITGIEYKNANNEYYFELFDSKQINGPFQKLHINVIDKESFIYRYQKEEKWYLNLNGTTYGPYRNINTPYFANLEKDQYYFTFQDEEYNYQVFYKEVIPQKFNSNPSISFNRDGTIFLSGSDIKQNNYDGITYTNGVKKILTKKSDITTNSYGDILELKAIDNNTKYNAPRNVYFGNEFMGKFHSDYIYAGNTYNSPYFSKLFYETEEETKNYYLIKKDQSKTLIGTSDEISNSNFYLVGEDYIYIRKSDSTLMINGKETKHKRVYVFNVKNSTGEILIVKIVGNYDVFIQNEKELTASQVQKTHYNPRYYNLKDNELQFEKIKDKMYVKPKGSSKSFGPISKYNTLLFSKENKHYLECNERGMELFLDGKLFSKGFNATYDKFNNQFVWFSMEDKKIYLNTYKND